MVSQVNLFLSDKSQPQFMNQNYNKNIEKVAISTIQFLSCWFAIVLFNRLSSVVCTMGTQQYKDCTNVFSDITCPIFYVETLGCPLNKAINAISSFGVTLAIFMAKIAVEKIHQCKQYQKSEASQEGEKA